MLTHSKRRGRMTRGYSRLIAKGHPIGVAFLLLIVANFPDTDWNFRLRVFCWLSAATFLIRTSIGTGNLSPLRGLQQFLLVASHGTQLRCQQLWVFILSHIQHNFLQCSHTGMHYCSNAYYMLFAKECQSFFKQDTLQ